MAEVLFYHLTQSPLERTLPDLLERTLARGWRAVVRAGVEARVGELDALLWSYSDASFLPHGTADMDRDADQPIYVTAGRANPNKAAVLMLVDGARFTPEDASGYERICLIFNGFDEGVLDNARLDWKQVKEAGLAGKYWAQDDGRWVQKATT